MSNDSQNRALPCDIWIIDDSNDIQLIELKNALDKKLTSKKSSNQSFIRMIDSKNAVKLINNVKEKHLHIILNLAPSTFLKAELTSQFVFVISTHKASTADLQIDTPFDLERLHSAFELAIKYLNNLFSLHNANQNIEIITKESRELTKVGIAMSAEKDLDKLLELVLQEGRQLGECEAASLYLLVGEKTGNPKLHFKLTQNSKINFDFKEKTFPLTNHSLAGYVALNGEILNIADAYNIGSELPFQFDKSFDQKANYRTRELLVIPMKNHQGKIIGVLQFINNNNAQQLVNKNVGFSQDKQNLLMGLASQAAVAIDNSQLIENIELLFEGFVAASVKAIESRDPVTSGHSFRVAELTTELAKVLDKVPDGKYKALSFSKSQIREIRYASLLHDFGKVGVKENVLLKPKKLHDTRLKYLELKLEWQKQLIQRKYFQSLVTCKDPEDISRWNQSEAYTKLQREIALLDQYKSILSQANQPSLLEEDTLEELNHLFDFSLDQSFPNGARFLSDDDFLSLSVRKGSLTAMERAEIQSHVVHTEAFLSQIPWTDELASVPKIAGAHHEKLDGTGYPAGMIEDEIPVASRIMAIADIYDALTARDRPYKKAVPLELALDILNQEANAGKLCQVMVEAFVKAQVYQVTE